jgi:hypothetical protein
LRSLNLSVSRISGTSKLDDTNGLDDWQKEIEELMAEKNRIIMINN